MPKQVGYRIERDSLGEKAVPADAYYGIQTLRAVENFPISGLKAKPVFITATALVKLSSSIANRGLGLLDKKRADAIAKASQEIVSGKLHGQFIVDVYQAGAGTSHNMNANEVIANRAIEMLGGKKGDYAVVHPNDHVNRSQSTNDAMPAALRVAILLSSPHLLNALKRLQTALGRKAMEFSSVIKSGRTHLQDAVPITLGQEFGSYASSVKGSAERVSAALSRIKRIGLGGTAAGTGINTHPLYRDRVLKALSSASGIKGLKKASDPFEAMNSMADFTALSGSMREAALELIRIANDIRLLSSGPRTGLSEIRLPAVQPGSSIMPGKVNPVMAEMLDMVCFQIAGADLTVSMAAQAGQLELNVMLPVINYNILNSMELLTNSVNAFTEKCVKGIKADRKRCADFFWNSQGLATVLNGFIGYEKAAAVAKESMETGRPIRDIVLEHGILTSREWDRLLRPGLITKPFDPRKVKRG